jgi:putative Mn2+ efflux pump MntP
LDPFTLLGTAMALAMDAFAVAVAISASLPRLTGRHVFRLAWHFGLFQALMPVAGWFGGRALSSFIAPIDHWVAFGLLFFLGVRMIKESFSGKDGKKDDDPTRGWSLVILSIATSLDALAVGVSVGLLRFSIWVPAVVIGVVTILLTVLATQLGRTAGHYLGKWAERVGGLVLMAIGTRILMAHLVAG